MRCFGYCFSIVFYLPPCTLLNLRWFFSRKTVAVFNWKNVVRIKNREKVLISKEWFLSEYVSVLKLPNFAGLIWELCNVWSIVRLSILALD